MFLRLRELPRIGELAAPIELRQALSSRKGGEIRDTARCGEYRQRGQRGQRRDADD
jgi:hypothetical protein